MRWSLKLSEFDHSIEHRKDFENKDADCLSRYPRVGVKENKMTVDINELSTSVFDQNVRTKARTNKGTSKKDLKIQKIIKAMEDPENQSIAQRD